MRGKIHSSHGGRKAYLNFELKDAPKARGLRPSRSLTSKFRYARVSRAMNWAVWPGPPFAPHEPTESRIHEGETKRLFENAGIVDDARCRRPIGGQSGHPMELVLPQSRYQN